MRRLPAKHALAQKLIAYRDQHGPIRSVEEPRHLHWWTHQARRAEPLLSLE